MPVQLFYKIPKDTTGTINIYAHLDDLRGAGQGTCKVFPLDSDPRDPDQVGVWVAQLFKDGEDLA